MANYDPRTGKKLSSGTTQDFSNYKGTFKYDTNTGKALSGPINASLLGKNPTKPLPPPVNNKDAQTTFSANLGALNENFTANPTQVQTTTAPTNQRNSILESIQGLIGKQGEQGARTAELNAEQDVIGKQTIARDLENQYTSKSRAYDKQVENIRKNEKGLFGGAVDQEVNRIERLRNAELADIAIQYKVAQGAYSDAVGIVDAQIKAEFEPLQNQISSLSNLYQLYADDLTESEKMAAQASIQERQTLLDQKYQTARDAKLQQYDLNKIAYQNSFDTTNQKIVNINGVDYVQNADGSFSLPSVPTNQTQVTSNIEQIDTVTGLLNNPGLKASVGTTGIFGRGGNLDFGAKKSSFLSGIQQLTSQLTLDNLINAKSRGATFGALSEGELNILAGGATKLNTWAKKDKNGNITGFKTSEANVRRELDKINNLAKRDFILKGGDPTQVGAVTQPDGTIWSLNSDGTYTQIQ